MPCARSRRVRPASSARTYLLIHKRGDTFETLLGIQQGGDDAARAHRIDRASLSGIAGASDVLIAEDAIFTEDDVHIRFTSRSDALLAFFRDAAAAEFNDVTKMPGNAVRWRRVDIGHLRSLELGNVFPPEGALRGWCDLRLAELE